ncbi:hypothetical protein FRC12_018758 [Ceratobasidium sp. 428]|nr:hypothetical protein FRC12_018758 [Ceratobasidium sp. 428]
MKACRAIILSPKYSKDDNAGTVTIAGGSGGHRRPAKSKGPIGLAKRYEMTEVTPPLIAYVTVVLRHALTSEDYSEDGTGFDYELFYNEIREHLEDPRHAQVTEATLKFWNDEVFGHCKRHRTAAGSGAERKGMRARLDAALEAGEDLGLGDTNQGEGEGAGPGAEGEPTAGGDGN